MARVSEVVPSRPARGCRSTPGPGGNPWKHGALSLALLEALTGRTHFGPPREVCPGTGHVVPLGDVQAYVSQRGRELARSLDKDPQNVVPLSKRLNASLIPLALRPTAP